MKILSYGEDPLTLWALTERLQDVLGQLSDSSDPMACELIYRPSFGRGGAAKAETMGSKARSEFGEFDAILNSQTSTYLSESKWWRSSESRGGVLMIAEHQVRRHAIFRWYLEAWRRRA